jgi:hypothetical protein
MTPLWPWLGTGFGITTVVIVLVCCVLWALGAKPRRIR